MSSGFAALMLLALAPAALAAPAEEQPYLNRSYLFVDNTEIQGYVESIVERLLATRKDSPRRPNVLVYSTDEFAASSDDRNNLLLSTRVLREVDSEDELAALVAHELTHLLKGHNQRKGAMRAFPVGVETAGWITAAADHSGRKSAAQGSLADFGKGALGNTQAVSLIWSDILTPGWNRAQEREADRGGYDLMIAAGYDPAAFGSLFSKLQSAQARRSERMELLKRVALQRLSRSAAQRASSSAGVIQQAGTRVKAKVEEVSVDAVFDRLTQFNRDYDSPEQRQKLLADYAEKRDSGRRDKTPRSPRLRQMLREGRGGIVLAADRDALRALASLNTGKVEEARKSMASVLASAKGTEPPSPHLNLALGAWYTALQMPAEGERRAQAWLKGRRPPAQAYLWRASYEWNRKAYVEAQSTLESGSKRVGSGATFLPFLVSTARAMGNEKRAEAYTKECLEEDRKGANAVFTMITFRGGVAPSGIYPECVRRLGHEPADESVAAKIVRAPVEAGRAISQKAKELFKKP